MAAQAVREQQQEDARAEREGGGEGAERAGQDLGDGVHAAVPEAREDARRDVQQPYEGAGTGHEGRYGLGAGAAEHPAELAVTAWNHTRHFPIYPDRHRIP